MKIIARFYAIIRLFIYRTFRDELLKQASALAYQSFMAIVPLLAVMFGIAKGFGMDEFLKRFLSMELKDHQEVLQYLLQFSSTTLQQAQGGVVAGVGVFFLLYTITKLISSVEKILTSMWGFSTRSTLSMRHLTNYIAVILLSPLLLAISSSATVFLTAQVADLMKGSSYLSSIPSSLEKIISLLPFVTTGVLFTLLLYALPSAPVSFFNACTAGFITAFIFQHVQAWYIIVQLHFTKISAVYGSFVALPLFLVWVWISWVLFLLSGELVVFLQERGWRKGIATYESSDFAALENELLVYEEAKKAYENHNVLTFSNLYESIERPIFSLTKAVICLAKKKQLFTTVNDNYRQLIVPKARYTTESCLIDMLLPEIPENTTEKDRELVDALSKLRVQWTQDYSVNS